MAPYCCPTIRLPFYSILFFFFSNFSYSSLQLFQPYSLQLSKKV
ncbi:hypothetical protein ES332_D07G230200v1 [Gossypium tomentosum]|uniref:Uncharacterized protein n=1 Tax=Gossypium tomentosum TaxID=34277 RepID=A0A5D2KAA7_GOSTO|nr:hypothetical protein ES332_D07G230200v1 [Gossypium tomentosum]